MKFYMIVLFCFLYIQKINSLNNINSVEFINLINNAQTDWEAEENEFSNKDIHELKRLMGLKLRPAGEQKLEHYIKDIEYDAKKIPTKFDARTNWPNCKTIKTIKDQSNCGSCWAVATASMLSDRLCVASKGSVDINLSAELLMTCCEACTGGDPGCEGGYIEQAVKYFKWHGLVTGGDYGSKEGCQPYGIKPCSTCRDDADTPKCVKNKCTNRSYKKKFRADLHKGRRYYGVPQNVTLIQAEIIKNGPVIAGFEVFEDFMSYKKGIYSYNRGESLGWHAVRVLGWGTENRIPYWLVANSWTPKWGLEGLFKIKLGTNECSFEENIVTALPIPK